MLFWWSVDPERLPITVTAAVGNAIQYRFVTHMLLLIVELKLPHFDRLTFVDAELFVSHCLYVLLHCIITSVSGAIIAAAVITLYRQVT